MKESLPEVFHQFWTLVISGAAGSFLRIVHGPKVVSVRARVIQGGSGVIAAVFLGGMLSRFISGFVGGEVGIETLLASGFIVGRASEEVIAAIQNRLGNAK